MTKNRKEIVVLDSDDSGSDVEVVSSSKKRHVAAPASNDVVDLTSARVSSMTSANQISNSRRRRRHTNDEVEFVGSTTARQPSAASAAASASSDIQFVGTKRPRPTNKNSYRAPSFPGQMNNFNNDNSIMNNPMSNAGGFMDRLTSMLGFGGGTGMNVLNRGNVGGMGMGMGFDPSADLSRYGPIPGVNDRPSSNNSKQKKAKSSSKPKEEETTAMMKGKAMEQPQGFDAIDMYYPRLKANDRTSILHNLISKCTTSGKSKKFVHDFRVKYEKENPKSTLWSLAKALSEEITRLEGESKMPSKQKLKSEEDDNHHKENKPNVGCIISNDESDSDKKPTAPIGSLSGAVLDTLATYFRAHLGQKEHKSMLDAIEPTESPGSLTCCICSDDFDAGHTVACSGDDIHFFCKPCLSSYCTLTLESGPIQSITCAIPDCKALFATHDIKSILSDYDILRIEHREDSRDRRVAMAAKAMLHCECGVVAIVTEEDMGDGRIACPGSGCGRRFCAKCGNEDHGKESCPPPAETVQWLDKHSKQCPNCSNRIEKNGGCDHMTCRPPGGCGHDFWWTCGCPFPGPHKCR